LNKHKVSGMNLALTNDDHKKLVDLMNQTF